MASSLKDVALRAGVSVRTVSNVVHDAPYVAPATRARVQAALAELDYRPNLAARTLRQGRSGLLGLVVPEIDSPYFGELAGLLADAAERRGATLVVDQTRGDPDRERRLLSGPSGQLVDGLLLSPWALSPAEVAARPAGVPLVLLGERYDDADDHVGVDSVAAARTATAHLVATGRRRVAAVGLQPHLANQTAVQRLTGYRTALTEAGRRLDPRLEVVVQHLHRADGAQAMQQLLALDEPPDAVFCFTDELALGAMRVAWERGVRVPDDVALVGFDDVEDGRWSRPSLSTVSPDTAVLAEVAVDRLLERVGGGGGAARSTTTPHALVVRESSAVRPPGAPPRPAASAAPGRRPRPA
jgi:DNA-binding LacI/PurR family transcriptional regulator